MTGPDEQSTEFPPGWLRRTLLTAAGFFCGVALIEFDNFFDGPCPDRYREAAAQFGVVPQPWFFGMTLAVAVIIAVVGIRNLR